MLVERIVTPAGGDTAPLVTPSNQNTHRHETAGTSILAHHGALAVHHHGCHRCGRPFGLKRHRILTFTGCRLFCSRFCKITYLKHIEQNAEGRRLQFMHWLARDSI